MREMRGVVTAGDFNDFRGMTDYIAVLGEEFAAQVARLVRGKRWLDVGAGHARAQKEYLLAKMSLKQRFFEGKAEVVAVAAEAPTKLNIHAIKLDTAVHGIGGGAGNLNELVGRYVEDIPDEELGKFNIITDVFGAVSYSERLDVVLNKYLRLLTEGGTLYVHTVSFHTQIIRKDGSKIAMFEWLQAIPGLRVTVGSTDFSITAERPGVVVPRLKLIGGKADAPPERLFQEI